MVMLCDKKMVEQARHLPLNEFVVEEKVDGTRCVATVSETVELESRGNIITHRYPELKEALIGLGVSGKTVLDSEIVQLVEGKSDFNALQPRLLLENKLRIELLSREKPCTFIVFDALKINGFDLTNLPLTERQKRLKEFLKGKENQRIQFVKQYPSLEQGWKEVKEKELEGVILKKKESVYSHTRSPCWIKVKAVKEAILDFDGYEENPKGITLTNPQGIRVSCAGQQSEQVKETIDKTGRATVCIQYLNKGKSGNYRQPTFKKLEGVIKCL